MQMPSFCCSVIPFWGKEGPQWSKPKSPSPLSPVSSFLLIGKGRLSGKITSKEGGVLVPNLDSNPVTVTTYKEDACLSVTLTQLHNVICQLTCTYLRIISFLNSWNFLDLVKRRNWLTQPNNWKGRALWVAVEWLQPGPGSLSLPLPISPHLPRIGWSLGTASSTLFYYALWPQTSYIEI